MKGKIFILAGILIIAVLAYTLLKPIPVWEKNAREFNNSFDMISGNAQIDNLSLSTKFEWDTLYSFAPYTSKDTVYETVGYKWNNISETVNEGMNQVVFLDKGKVVCYIYGYPERYNIYFDFGHYAPPCIKLTTDEKLVFDMSVLNNGIRVFEYAK